MRYVTVKGPSRLDKSAQPNQKGKCAARYLELVRITERQDVELTLSLRRSHKS
jgi:hypothetical protein